MLCATYMSTLPVNEECCRSSCLKSTRSIAAFYETTSLLLHLEQKYFGAALLVNILMSSQYEILVAYCSFMPFGMNIASLHYTC